MKIKIMKSFRLLITASILGLYATQISGLEGT